VSRVGNKDCRLSLSGTAPAWLFGTHVGVAVKKARSFLRNFLEPRAMKGEKVRGGRATLGRNVKDETKIYHPVQGPRTVEVRSKPKIVAGKLQTKELPFSASPKRLRELREMKRNSRDAARKEGKPQLGRFFEGLQGTS